jgi:hypothetical protein
MLFDTMPGGPGLARFADQASDGFENVSDDELLGVLCAWDRVAVHATARKYAAVAELIRRRPAAGWPVDTATGMPQVWDEFTPSELCAVLAESKGDAVGMLGLAHDLETKLPGTGTRSWMASCPRRRPRSSPVPPLSSTPTRPAPPRPWSWTGLEGGIPDGTFRWTSPSGRTCTTEPTRYPI